MNKISTKMMVEGGIMIALAQVLSYVKLFEAPNGGSVTAGSMIPILIFAIRWGFRPGILVGIVYGVLQFILGPKYSFHPVSILFDYFIAFGFLGFAGLSRKSYLGIVWGVCLGILGRFISHVISGVVVFSSYAPEGTNPWVYSFLYNGSYLSIELVLSLVIISLLYRPLKKHLASVNI